MRSAFAGGLALLLAPGLSGCGESPFDPDVPEEAVAGDDVQLEPGLYRMQISIGGPQGGATNSQYADDNTCLTPEDVEGGYRDMLLEMQGRDACRFTSWQLEGENLEAVMACAGDASTPETQARIAGTLTPTATDLRMTVAGFGDAGAPGGGGIEMAVTSERIGDCP